MNFQSKIEENLPRDFQIPVVSIETSDIDIDD